MRLTAAVVGSAGACWFFVLYNHFSSIRFDVEHHGGTLTPANQMFVTHGIWCFVLPAAILILGLWLRLKHPQATVVFEALILTAWLLALALDGMALVSWQIQNIPVFSGMSGHF